MRRHNARILAVLTLYNIDVSKLEGLGWKYKTELEEGIRLTYDDFLHNPMRAER